MESEEVRKIGKLLEPYVTYDGFNLWDICFGGIYNVFLKNPSRKNFLFTIKSNIIRMQISRIHKKRETVVQKELKDSDIFALTYDINHVHTIIPLLKKFNHEIIQFDSPSKEITKKTLEKLSLPYLGLDSLMDIEMAEKLLAADKFLDGKWKDFESDEKIKKILGENYEFIYDVLKYHMKTRRRFLEVIRMELLVEKLYSLKKCKLIIVSDDVNPLGQIACKLAREKNIKSLVMQHGQLVGNPLGVISADKMVVNGYADKKYLEEMGAEVEKIIVTGQPRFDKLSEMNLSKSLACEDLGWDKTKKRLIFSLQMPTKGENVTVSAAKCFIEEVNKIKDKENYEFVITHRPDFDEKFLPTIPEGLEIKFSTTEDIHKVILSSDVYITAFSTLAVEAVLLNRPVLSINLDSNEYVDYSKAGVGHRILNAEEFLPRLNEILEEEKFKVAREKFIENYNYKLDGNARERIIRVIDKLLL
nr:hypothetical protein [archaeon]